MLIPFGSNTIVPPLFRVSMKPSWARERKTLLIVGREAPKKIASSASVGSLSPIFKSRELTALIKLERTVWNIVVLDILFFIAN